MRHLFQEFPIVLRPAVEKPTKLAKVSEVTQVPQSILLFSCCFPKECSRGLSYLDSHRFVCTGHQRAQHNLLFSLSFLKYKKSPNLEGFEGINKSQWIEVPQKCVRTKNCFRIRETKCLPRAKSQLNKYLHLQHVCISLSFLSYRKQCQNTDQCRDLPHSPSDIPPELWGHRTTRGENKGFTLTYLRNSIPQFN